MIDGFILDKYLEKNVEIVLRNNEGLLNGKLTKNGKSFFLETFLGTNKLTISRIAAVKAWNRSSKNDK